MYGVIDGAIGDGISKQTLCRMNPHMALRTCDVRMHQTAGLDYWYEEQNRSAVRYPRIIESKQRHNFRVAGVAGQWAPP